MENEDKIKALDSLAELSKTFNEAFKEIEREEEVFWDSLTDDQRISAFCCVSRRIHKGDVVDNGTYRYVLYDVCEFGPEAYARAQMAGYLDIHNCIMTPEQERDQLISFCQSQGLDNAEDRVKKFLNPWLYERKKDNE